MQALLVRTCKSESPCRSSWLHSFQRYSLPFSLTAFFVLTSNSFHHDHNRLVLDQVQVEGWASVPAEVLEDVLIALPSRDVWAARKLCKQWAYVARKVSRFEVVIDSVRSVVCSKLRVIRKRRASYPNVQFTLKINTPVHVQDCARLLWDVRQLVRAMQTTVLCSSLRFVCLY